MPDRFLVRLLLALFALPWVLAGCSGSRPASPPEEAAEDGGYVRDVAPFPVRDADGDAYEHPFLGGFNTPRPQFVDIDNDGDADLFVQERSGAVMFFENTGSPDDPQLTWRTDRYRDLDVGEWFRFADLNQDGVPDLLAEQPYSYIRYYRNEGTAEAPEFVLAVDSLKDADGEAIFSDRQNIPNVTNIDCDDRLDLFVGRLDGTVMRYEATGEGEDGVPRFALVTRRFEGIEIVGQIGTLHGANTLTFADVDGDGDQDLFWGDFFEPSLLLIENTGSCEDPDLRNEPEPFPPPDPVSTSGYNAPTLTDFNGDGRLDLLVGVLGGAYSANTTLADNLYFYEGVGNGRFRLQTKQFIGQIDVGSESAPAFGDLDGDGDPDLLLANKIDPDSTSTSLVYVFENEGTPTEPSYRKTGTLDLPEAYHYAPALGDLDGDGRVDLLLGTWKGKVAYYRNDDGRFAREDAALVEMPGGSNAAPALGDLDGDGDLDLLVGESNGTLNLYRNEGTPERPAFTLEAEEFEGIDVGSRAAPALVDLDGDGDLDLIVGAKDGTVTVYRNEGTPEAPQFVEGEPLPIDAPRYATPALVDLDGDGDADVVTGGEGGGLHYFERR